MLTKKKAFYLVFCMVLGFFVYYRGITPLIAQNPESDDNNIYKQLELFNTVISKVQHDYVEEVPAKDLIYGALKGMLGSLDSHSQFMDPESYGEMKVDTEGQFGGLGIEITVKDHILTVVSPIEDTPAFRAGVAPNDRIIKIEGKSTKNMSLTEAVKKLRGKPGTPVRIHVLRPDTNEFLEFEIVRDIIKIQSVKDTKLVAEDIGYVRVTQFQENTAKELEEALKELESKNIRGLILDLRNNPGGLLNEAVDVADKFIGGNKVIVSTKGRIPSQNKEYRASHITTHPNVPLVVLINGGSASGSEIVAGAIQDWKRGILIGTKSFGKASVQSVLPLQDGSALRLTTAHYYTPNGRLIHKVGIEPDITVEYNAAKKKDGVEEKEEEDKPFPFDDDEEEKKEEPEFPEIKDNQLLRAVDLLKGLMIINQQGVLSKTDTETNEKNAVTQ